jgi:hypothetical protein
MPSLRPLQSLIGYGGSADMFCSNSCETLGPVYAVLRLSDQQAAVTAAVLLKKDIFVPKQHRLRSFELL